MADVVRTDSPKKAPITARLQDASKLEQAVELANQKGLTLHFTVLDPNNNGGRAPTYDYLSKVYSLNALKNALSFGKNGAERPLGFIPSSCGLVCIDFDLTKKQRQGTEYEKTIAVDMMASLVREQFGITEVFSYRTVSGGMHMYLRCEATHYANPKWDNGDVIHNQNVAFHDPEAALDGLIAFLSGGAGGDERVLTKTELEQLPGFGKTLSKDPATRAITHGDPSVVDRYVYGVLARIIRPGVPRETWRIAITGSHNDFGDLAKAACERASRELDPDGWDESAFERLWNSLESGKGLTFHHVRQLAAAEDAAQADAKGKKWRPEEYVVEEVEWYPDWDRALEYMNERYACQTESNSKIVHLEQNKYSSTVWPTQTSKAAFLDLFAHVTVDIPETRWNEKTKKMETVMITKNLGKEWLQSSKRRRYRGMALCGPERDIHGNLTEEGEIGNPNNEASMDRKGRLAVRVNIPEPIGEDQKILRVERDVALPHHPLGWDDDKKEPIKMQIIQHDLLWEMHDYLETIWAGGNLRMRELIKDFIADRLVNCFRQPVPIAIWAIGDQGCGKSTLADLIVKPVLGPKLFYKVRNVSKLLGLSGSNFNWLIAGRSFLHFDEAIFERDRKLAARLKDFVTEDEHQFEKKYQDEYIGPQLAAMYSCSNSAIAALLDLGDRRNVVHELHISWDDEELSDGTARRFFAPYRLAFKNSIPAMRQYFLERGASPSFDRDKMLDIPTSEAKIRAVLAGDPMLQFLIDCANQGFIPGDTGGYSTATEGRGWINLAYLTRIVDPTGNTSSVAVGSSLDKLLKGKYNRQQCFPLPGGVFNPDTRDYGVGKEIRLTPKELMLHLNRRQRGLFSDTDIATARNSWQKWVPAMAASELPHPADQPARKGD